MVILSGRKCSLPARNFVCGSGLRRVEVPHRIANNGVPQERYPAMNVAASGRGKPEDLG